ncbi:hypothetical protein PCE1_003026 [Barthelona sp. PCE]
MSDPRARPLADEELTATILDLVQQASERQIRRGANETAKNLNKSLSQLVVVAADATPFEIVMHLPYLCEDKNVPYVYVPSKVALGRASGVSRAVLAVSFEKRKNSHLNDQIETLCTAVEQINV